MDINLLRALVMVLLLICFVAIALWAYSDKRKQDFQQAARIPLDENEDEHPATIGQSQ